MPLPLIVDSLDSVPEPMRSAYVEADGKFRLDLDGYEDPAGLKSALQKEREAAKLASKQAQAYAGLGKSADEIRALIEQADKAEQEKLSKSGEWEKLREQIITQHKGELGKKDERISAMTSSLERRLVDADATAAIAAAKGVPALLLPHVRNQTKVIEDGGEFVVRVIDKAGNPRVDGKGEFLSIADLVSEMRQSDVFGRAFEATGTSGSGAFQSSGNAGAKTIKEADFMARPPKERAALMKSGVVVV